VGGGWRRKRGGQRCGGGGRERGRRKNPVLNPAARGPYAFFAVGDFGESRRGRRP
jgi:hypothetical protein